jgi:nicotinate-nucleotide adenylyltransferase
MSHAKAEIPLADLRLPPFAAGMRVGLFGGSFDPPHEGHLAVSRVGLSALGLDQVWWLVSPQNPLKPNAPSSDLSRRIAAARATARDPRIRITGIEAALHTTFTAETLGHLLPRLHGVHCLWMMGADNLQNFHRWRGWTTIAASLPIAVFNRPGLALPALSAPAARAVWQSRLRVNDALSLAARPPPAWVFLPSPHIAISSTALRGVSRLLHRAS